MHPSVWLQIVNGCVWVTLKVVLSFEWSQCLFLSHRGCRNMLLAHAHTHHSQPPYQAHHFDLNVLKLVSFWSSIQHSSLPVGLWGSINPTIRAACSVLLSPHLWMLLAICNSIRRRWDRNRHRKASAQWRASRWPRHWRFSVTWHSKMVIIRWWHKNFCHLNIIHTSLPSYTIMLRSRESDLSQKR